MNIEGGHSYKIKREGWYPRELVKIDGQWYMVEDSHRHGGIICRRCSWDRHISFNTIWRDGKAVSIGSRCYRSLVPRIEKPQEIQGMGLYSLPKLAWAEYVRLVKEQFGEPEILS